MVALALWSLWCVGVAIFVVALLIFIEISDGLTLRDQTRYAAGKLWKVCVSAWVMLAVMPLHPPPYWSLMLVPLILLTVASAVLSHE